VFNIAVGGKGQPHQLFSGEGRLNAHRAALGSRWRTLHDHRGLRRFNPKEKVHPFISPELQYLALETV
jgi:hypothetical protein